LLTHEQEVKVRLPKVLEMVEQLSWQAVPVQTYPPMQVQEVRPAIPLVLTMVEQFSWQADPVQ
jgi:hypothetical protein